MILKPRLFRKPNKGHRLSRGLVGYWLLNESSGNKVFDLSGNGNTGTLVANTHWVPGGFGPSAILAPEFDYIGFDSEIVGAGDVTFWMWVYLTDKSDWPNLINNSKFVIYISDTDGKVYLTSDFSTYAEGTVLPLNSLHLLKSICNCA